MQLEDTKLPDLCPDTREYKRDPEGVFYTTTITRDTNCIGEVKEVRGWEFTTLSVGLICLLPIIILIGIGVFKVFREGEDYFLKD